MKSILNSIVKFTLLICAMSLLMTNCEQEKMEPPENQPKLTEFFKLSQLSSDDLKQNSILRQKLNHIQEQSGKIDMLNREIYNSDYDFYIETDSVKFMESMDGLFHSYTFPIVKDSTETILRNLVLY